MIIIIICMMITFRLTRSLFHSSKCLSMRSLRLVSSTQEQRPLMLMDLPQIAYPNVFLMVRNFFSRAIINGYFDSSFAIQSFCDGARQALIVVSHLIANEQFNDLNKLVTREVLNEVRENYQLLSPGQREQIAVKETEIVFSHPYLIGMMMDEEAKSRSVEITMIFHVLKNLEFYRDEMLQNTGNTLFTWTSTVKKMRDNMIICNYKFLRDMTKDARDDSWTITGLNHWSLNEYLQN